MYFLPLSYVTIYSLINLAFMKSMPWNLSIFFLELLPGDQIVNAYFGDYSGDASTSWGDLKVGFFYCHRLRRNFRISWAAQTTSHPPDFFCGAMPQRTYGFES
jgi:hypothetical protein